HLGSPLCLSQETRGTGLPAGATATAGGSFRGSAHDRRDHDVAQPCRASQSTTIAAVAAGSRLRACVSPGSTLTSILPPPVGTPNGSRSPLTTSVDTASGSSPTRLRSGLPGGCSGNASASTPTAPSSAAVRQATRAPLERPPTISGVFEVGRAACRGRGGSGAVGPPRAKRSDARGGEA